MQLLELVVRNITRYPHSATSTPIRYQPAIHYLLPWTRFASFFPLWLLSMYIQTLKGVGLDIGFGSMQLAWFLVIVGI
jgi:hypothetical protein